MWITALVLWAVYDNHSVTWTLLGGFVLPFLAFNCIMGFVIYVQHTHPEVAWFDKREEWQKRLGFITTTVNVVVPKRMGQILHDILEHGAHHVNTGVPLYRLRAAQTALKNAVPQLARVYVLTWKRYWATVRTCKLYDYANHRWMDFKGRVTAAPLFPEATRDLTPPNDFSEKQTARLSAPFSFGAQRLTMPFSVVARERLIILLGPASTIISRSQVCAGSVSCRLCHSSTSCVRGTSKGSGRMRIGSALAYSCATRSGMVAASVEPSSASGSCSRLGSVR